jgi:hypothetical protein
MELERKRPLMPHFKCAACKTRLYSAAALTDLVSDLCPGCGSPLEPVGDLAEIVGFRSIGQRDDDADDRRPRRPRRWAGRVDALFAHRDALLAQERLDAGRWVDDDGSFSPETVAQAIALPVPEENP